MSKQVPNAALIEDRMTRTLAWRRQSVISKPLPELLGEYPALKLDEQVNGVTFCDFIKLWSFAFSALTLLVGRQEGHPARVVVCWCGCLSGARCRLAYGPADVTATATHCLLLQ